MKPARILTISVVVLLAVPVFFEVTLNPVFRLPRDVQRADPEQERRFAACMDGRDARIHERAFATIDNPDVQKEYIAAHRDRARAACRREFPERLVTVREPFRFNLVDLEPRFGRELSYR